MLSEVASHALWMQKEGYRTSTIESAVSSLKSVAHKANLLSPEAVKSYLAKANLSEGRKETLVVRLARFYKWKQIPFQQPRYKRDERLPFIPLETEIDQLISSMKIRTATFLQAGKETGARPGELWRLCWTDIDFENRAVTINPEKHSHARQLPISTKLIAMISQLPTTSQFVFRKKIEPLVYFRRSFERTRKRLAIKLQNPRLERISFKTLRHFKATMEYHRTKDILHVMQLLGHKNIRNTLVYTHLVNFQSDEFISKVAKTIKEAEQLIEAGFDYVTTFDGNMLFRKRK